MQRSSELGGRRIGRGGRERGRGRDLSSQSEVNSRSRGGVRTRGGHSGGSTTNADNARPSLKTRLFDDEDREREEFEIKPSTSAYQPQLCPTDVERLSPVMPIKACLSPVLQYPPSPVMNIEIGGSGTSTPSLCRSGLVWNTDGLHHEDYVTVAAEAKQSTLSLSPLSADEVSMGVASSFNALNVEVGAPSSSTTTFELGAWRRGLNKQSALVPAKRKAPAASSVRRTGMSEAQIQQNLCYGSDEDTSDGDENDGELQPLFVPRVARQYLLDEDSDEEEATLKVDYSWPPTCPIAPSLPATITEGPLAAADSKPPADSLISDPSLGAPFPQKFYFDWRQFPQPQISPELRRERFTEISGPSAYYDNPYDAFVSIWDEPIMQHITNETNKYAQQKAEAMLRTGIAPNSRITKWRDTTADELYTYFAIIMATGIVIKSRLEEYWNSSKDIFSTPQFNVAMSYDRFCLINKCLHFNDNATCTAERLSRDEAKVHKILPIVEHLNKKFSSLYNLAQNIALDESLTQWKGWLSLKQHLPNKAAKVGIKTYEVCESQSGYLWRFELEARQFRGLEEDSNPLAKKITALVLRLLVGLEHRGHTIWMDNFYNSPALARELKVLGFDCAGTLRLNRQFVPIEMANLQNKDLPVGQVCGCTSGDVDLVVWRDKKRIALISTYHGLTAFNINDTIKPTLIHDYNVCMGGVDKKDQMLAMYPIERKRTQVWYKKLFRRILNASILNAYIMFRANKQMSHRNFRKILVTQLLKRHNICSRPRVPTFSTVHVPKFLQMVDSNKGHARRLRRKCIVCSKLTTSYCEGCGGKSMCLPTCFSQCHLP